MANDVKETIVRESVKLFLAKGFRGTSVKQITEAAGIARGTLYWHFKSKDEILENVLRKFEHEFVDGFMEKVGKCSGDFISKYKILHKLATEFARDNKELSLVFHTLLIEIVGTNTPGETIAKGVWERYRLFIQGLLEGGKREGTIGPEIDPVIYSHIIAGSHTGMLVEWLVHDEILDVRTFVKTFRALLLKGITGAEE